jgi:hypothetical protein
MPKREKKRHYWRGLFDCIGFTCLIMNCIIDIKVTRASYSLNSHSMSGGSSNHHYDKNNHHYNTNMYFSIETMTKIRANNYKVSALMDKSVTLSCSIDLDDIDFPSNDNYKIIWSRKTRDGRDYEPLFLDDSRLTFDSRISANRLVIHKKSFEQIQWNLIIQDLNPSDSNSYICQLNKKPYDTYWLKRFVLTVFEPARFQDEYDNLVNQDNKTDEKQQQSFIYGNDNSMFIKSFREQEAFQLKCLTLGKPTPTISWYLKYINGTSVRKLNIYEVVFIN